MEAELQPKLLKDDNGAYRYGVGALLGEGSYGVVREGINLATCGVFAIKTLDKRLLKKQRRGLENLKREVQVHKLLGSHASIVELKDVIESKTKVHLVLGYMHCGSVQDVLDRAPGRRLGRHFQRLQGVGHAHLGHAGVACIRAEPASYHRQLDRWVGWSS